MLENFIKQFGGTTYGAQAQKRLDDLKKQQVSPRHLRLQHAPEDAQREKREDDKAEAERQAMLRKQLEEVPKLEMPQGLTSFDGTWTITQKSYYLCRDVPADSFNIRIQKAHVTGHVLSARADRDRPRPQSVKEGPGTKRTRPQSITVRGTVTRVKHRLEIGGPIHVSARTVDERSRQRHEALTGQPDRVRFRSSPDFPEMGYGRFVPILLQKSISRLIDRTTDRIAFCGEVAAWNPSSANGAW